MFTWMFANRKTKKSGSRRRRPQPVYEALEQRWTPAAASFAGGELVIDLDDAETLVVTQIENNEFEVGAGGAFGTFADVTSLIVNGSDSADDLTIALADKMYMGDMTLDLGEGDDTVAVSSALGAGSKGNVEILTREGDDMVTLTSCVEGDFFLRNKTGNDSLLITGGSIDIGGRAFIDNVPNITVTPGGNSVGENLIIRNDQDGLASVIDLGGITVGGNFRLTTADEVDQVELDGITVDGNFIVSLNGGADNLRMDDDVANNVFHGVANVNLGDGNDIIRIDSAAEGNTTFDSNFNLDLGEGDHSLHLFNEKFVVLGNFILKAGDGNNFVPVANSISAIVTGDMKFLLGGGDNTILFNGDVGGKFVYRAGDGTNDITIDDSNLTSPTLLVSIRTGSGDDTLSLVGTSMITGTVNLDGGTNVFDQGTWTLVSPFRLII